MGVSPSQSMGLRHVLCMLCMCAVCWRHVSWLCAAGGVEKAACELCVVGRGLQRIGEV